MAVHPIDDRSWEERHELVPLGDEQDVETWMAGLESDGAKVDSASPFDGMVFVVAARFPGPGRRIRYFALTRDDLDAAGTRAAAAVSKAGRLLGRIMGPTVHRWKAGLREAFVSLDEVAALASTDRATAQSWADSDPTFPEVALRRAEGPLFVREEVEQWLGRADAGQEPGTPDAPPRG